MPARWYGTTVVCAALAAACTARVQAMQVTVDDEIRLIDNHAGDSAVVIIDSCRQGTPAYCADDDVERLGTSANIPNRLCTGPCGTDEIIVFSDDNAMLLFENTAWTDAGGDVQELPLSELLRPRLIMWIVRTDPAAPALAEADVQRAEQLYNTMNCGIGFTYEIIDRSAHATALEALEAYCDKCETIKDKVGYRENNINVYYLEPLDPMGPASSAVCECGIVIISPTANNETLAHELGHTFTLGHAEYVDVDGDGYPDFDDHNVMSDQMVYDPVTGEPEFRDSITEGQCFRCNVKPDSVLNTLGIRYGPLRCCEDYDVGPRCPAITLDVTPD